MFPGSDAGALAEVAAGAETVESYEHGVFAILGAKVGFDVAMFKRADGLGRGAFGLDARIARECQPFFAQFAREIEPVWEAAAQHHGVAVDIDVFGQRRIERLSYYQRLMRPHGGKATAIVCLARRGRPIASLSLGRTSSGFSSAELDYLRELAPTLAVCESTALAPAPPSPWLVKTAHALTPRERDVLAYLHLGYTNAQIAAVLGTAQRTVRNQLSSLYEKLGVASRAEAAAIAIELGLGRTP